MSLPNQLLPLILMLGGIWVSGCASSSAHVERSTLSNELERRTGHALRSANAVSNDLPLGINLTNRLSPDDTVALALWNNSAFQENLSKLGLARGDLAQAGMLANPTFSMLFPLGPKQLEFAATFPLEAIWLRPRRVAIARLDAERVAAGLLQSGLDLVRDVRVAVSDLELARDRLRLNVEAVALQERIEKITQDRKSAGESSSLETAAARVELARAHDDAVRIGHDVVVANERLLFLVGLNDGVTKLNFVTTSSPPALALSLTELENRALAARPDLRACELAVESAGKRAGLAEAEIFTLSGIIDANRSGRKGFEIGPGALLTLPIFNQNQAGRARAKAELERATWNCIGTQQRIRLEVREAYRKQQQAAGALENWREQLVPSLRDLVGHAEVAYVVGELAPLVFQDYARQLVTARMREAELAADLRRAWAELQRAVGTQLVVENK